jgi:uncharacterized membrane protein
MAFALALLLCLGAGTVGGVFFGFSSFIMRALADLPAAQGVAAMQRINLVVLNPAFIGVFMGSAALSLACIAFAAWRWGAAADAPWLLAAGLAYGLGCFGVTMAFNVPRNERLARLDAASADAQAYWPRYVREWTRWNHVRTAASLAGAGCAAAALAVAP